MIKRLITRFLIYIFGEKKLVDAKVLVYPEPPFEFITNPPAKEMSEKNRLEIEAKREEEKRIEKIQSRQRFIDGINEDEKRIDYLVRQAIQNGQTSKTITYSDEKFMSKHKFNRMFTQYYLAARRFRNRGFKITMQRKESPVYPAIYHDYRDVKVSYTYRHELIISWD